MRIVVDSKRNTTSKPALLTPRHTARVEFRVYRTSENTHVLVGMSRSWVAMTWYLVKPMSHIFNVPTSSFEESGFEGPDVEK